MYYDLKRLIKKYNVNIRTVLINITIYISVLTALNWSLSVYNIDCILIVASNSIAIIGGIWWMHEGIENIR